MPNRSSTSTAFDIVGQSLEEPITTPTSIAPELVPVVVPVDSGRSALTRQA
jgi:hypothetical protein